MHDTLARMGLMSDFIVATPEEAARYPDGDLACRLQSTGFTGLELGALWALLAGEPWDVHRHTLELVGDHGREGPWLMRFPAPLIAQLAALSPVAVAPVAAAWVATEATDGFEEAGAVELIRELQALARNALMQAPARTLYLHVNL